jgi:hypothetical protein
MNEEQLRELLGKGLPKIAAASINAVFPLGFQVSQEPARDYAVEAQVVGSQLIYTRNFQICAFLIMEASHILKLGQGVFPRHGRAESVKMVVSANGEALNTVMGKLAYLVGKVDAGAEVVTSPPIVLNCSGPNRISVRGDESLFLKLAAADLSALMISVVQRI